MADSGIADALAKVERTLRFRLPEPYRAFAERGYLTQPGRAYLHVHEAMWFAPADISQQEQLVHAHTLKPGLVTFARSGGRDLWCWQTLRTSEAGEPPIAFCPRDSDRGWWHAPSFIGWLYRAALESLVPMWVDEAQARKDLRRWASLIREFGPADWGNDLDALAMQPAHPLRTPRGEHPSLQALLTAEEIRDRIRDAFGAAYLDAEFVYDVNGEHDS